MQFHIARATMRAPLGVERAAGCAAVVHLAREQVCDDRAYDEYAAQDGKAYERVSQPLYFSFKLRW